MTPSSSPPYDPLRILAALNSAGADYVVIGGFAARLWGSATVTQDTDICYARDHANLTRLAGVLSGLNARLRGVGDEVPFLMDARTLARGDHFTFETDAGDLDCLGTPKGSAGFEALARNAAVKDLGDGLVVKVAALEDIVLMKKAVGRPKDLIELEVLGKLQEEIEAAESGA